MRDEPDVIVVGAGLSGLTTARALHRAGADVLVVEARDRVGGRTRSQRVGAGTFDLGAQWIGPTQTRMHRLVDEYGLETFPTAHEGQAILRLHGKQRTYGGTIPRLSLLSLAQLQRAIRSIERAAKRVPAGVPGAADDASTLDHVTLGTWMTRQGVRDDVRGVVTAGMRVVFGLEPEELSMLQFLSYVHAAGGLMGLIETENGAQETRFVTGAQTVAERLAEEVDGRVRLGTAVREVRQHDGHVEVGTSNGGLRAGRLVVAVPPRLASRFDWDPLPPTPHRRFLGGSPMGATIKCIALYAEPFWHDEGLSGEAVSDDGPLSVVFDNSTPEQPALLGFSVGAPAREWGAAGPGQRRSAVFEQLTQLFGARAGRPDDYVDLDWAGEHWTGGCPVALPAPGVTATGGGDPRQPWQRVHWAGTELATEWRGYLEGAVESGAGAAREILEAS